MSRRPRTQEHIAKLAATLRGKPRSLEVKEKLRIAALKAYAERPEIKEKIRAARHSQPSPMKGRQHSTEAKAKMRLARLGKVPWNKGKGNKRSEDKRIRQSKEYKEWRTKVFARDDYTCQMCRKRGGTLNADHIKPFALFPALRFDIDNGRTLCESPCHKLTDTYGRRA